MKIVLFLFCLLLLLPTAVAVQVNEGTIFQTEDANVNYYMDNDFNFTNITVYPLVLNINGGNITVEHSASFLNVSIEVLNNTDFYFTINETVDLINITDNFGNLSINTSTPYGIYYQSNDTILQNDISGINSTFETILAGSYYIKESDYIWTQMTVINSIRKNENAVITASIKDYDNNIQSVIAKVQETNYTMTETSEGEWAYVFSNTQLPTRYYIYQFFAIDKEGNTNSSFWDEEFYFDVLPSTGTGSTGGGYYIPPTPTPIPTPTPVPTPTPIIPPTEEVEEVIEIITDKLVETLDVKKSGITMELIILVALVAVLIYYANRRKKE